jgi:hypothetical protein
MQGPLNIKFQIEVVQKSKYTFYVQKNFFFYLLSFMRESGKI